MPEIRIDTAELTYPWFWIPGHLAHFLDGSVPGGAVVNLDPGVYPFQQTRDRACDVAFRETPYGRDRLRRRARPPAARARHEHVARRGGAGDAEPDRLGPSAAADVGGLP